MSQILMLWLEVLEQAAAIVVNYCQEMVSYLQLEYSVPDKMSSPGSKKDE